MQVDYLVRLNGQYARQLVPRVLGVRYGESHRHSDGQAVKMLIIVKNFGVFLLRILQHRLFACFAIVPNNKGLVGGGNRSTAARR